MLVLATLYLTGLIGVLVLVSREMYTFALMAGLFCAICHLQWQIEQLRQDQLRKK